MEVVLVNLLHLRSRRGLAIPALAVEMYLVGTISTIQTCLFLPELYRVDLTGPDLLIPDLYRVGLTGPDLLIPELYRGCLTGPDLKLVLAVQI